nr:hypothetical protein ACMD2_23578 [Ipomoea batatas]
MAASIAATETQTEQCSKYCTAFRAFRPSRAAGDGESKRKLEVDESVRKIRSEVKSKVEAKMGKGGFSRASMFQIIASLFLIAVFALAETNPFGGPSCFTVVGVKEGDTCFDIAKSFNGWVYLTDKHLNAALEEQEPTPQFIDVVNRHKGGQNVNSPSNSSRHKRSIIPKPDGLRPVFPLQHVSPRMLHFPRGLTRLHQVVELFVHVVESPDLLEPFFGHVVVATLDQGVGGLREEEGADDDEQSRDDGAAQAQPPSPRDLGEEVV